MANAFSWRCFSQEHGIAILLVGWMSLWLNTIILMRTVVVNDLPTYVRSLPHRTYLRSRLHHHRANENRYSVGCRRWTHVAGRSAQELHTSNHVTLSRSRQYQYHNITTTAQQLLGHDLAKVEICPNPTSNSRDEVSPFVGESGLHLIQNSSRLWQ